MAICVAVGVGVGVEVGVVVGPAHPAKMTTIKLSVKKRAIDLDLFKFTFSPSIIFAAAKYMKFICIEYKSL